MFIEIINAKHLEKYKIRLWFNNGEVRDIDLAHSLTGDIFEPLHDIQVFKNFHISFNTIEWENGADFAPEYLYEHSVPVDSTIPGHADYAAEDRAPYNER